MKKYLIPLFLVGFFITLVSYSSTPKTPEEVLAEIPFIDSFRKITSDPFFESTYEVWFKMPIDHNNPGSPSFPLKAYYSHKDFNKPMVVVIDGYAIYTSSANELTEIIDANQLTIEHRFFDHSKPKDSIPWTYLNVRQAAADEHQIIQAFKPYYKGKWASTGISKSGQATIYHRRYYPTDVDISVPYVAPLNFSSEDPRFYSFFKNVGTKACRDKVYQYQLSLFKNKKAIMPLFEKLAKENGWEFSMGLDKAYDLCVLEYAFSFWQWGHSCEDIPPAGSIPLVLFNELCIIDPFSFLEEKEIENVRPFFYQSMTETGSYGYEVEPFKKYLKDKSNITFDFTMPKGHIAVFHPEVMKDINLWLRDSGNYMLYIYGQNDPYNSTSVDPGNKTNAVKMVNPGGCHASRIASFPVEMQDSIYRVLGKWLDMNLLPIKNKE